MESILKFLLYFLASASILGVTILIALVLGYIGRFIMTWNSN